MENNSCTLFHGDVAQCESIIVLKRITGTLSLFGCLFMIASIWLFRKYNVMAQRLILYLSIAALCDALGYMIGDMSVDGPTCDFEAWWLTYFDWTVLMWVSCITFNLFLNVVRHQRTNNLEKYYHVVCWILPSLLFSLLPLAGDNYGPAGAWCWIKHDSPWWRFVIWYIPLFIIIVILFAAYIYIIVYLRKQMSRWQGNYNPDSERNHTLIEEDIKVLKAYPFIYLLLSIFPLILRIHNAFTEEGDDIYALWVLTVLSAPMQGAINAVVFGLDPDTRKKLTWAHIQLAWASHFQGSGIREYPTLSGDDARAVSDTMSQDHDVTQQQMSIDRQSYSSLH